MKTFDVGTLYFFSFLFSHFSFSSLHQWLVEYFIYLQIKEQYYWLFNIELVDTCWRKNRRFYLSVITLLFVAVAFYIFFFFIFALLFLVIVQFDRIPKLEWNGKRQQLSYFLFLYVWRSFREKSLSDFHLFPFFPFLGMNFHDSILIFFCWKWLLEKILCDDFFL